MLHKVRFIFKNGTDLVVTCEYAEMTMSGNELTGYHLWGVKRNSLLFMNTSEVIAVVNENPVEDDESGNEHG